ncbi:MAG: carboxypeptidase-like regulatory domain-containing protein, partial [Methylotenera sp.]|nr:carboxypeptidase-like regulatory domain-containing protein [Flavobacterium sp.]
MRLYLLFFALFLFKDISAQKIYGTVFNSNGDLLPYASISVKGTTKGTSANDKAKYALNLAPGTYTFICQNLGYTSAEKKLTVTIDTELSFVLTEQKLSMEAVVIKNGGEDPAYEIIRNAIKKRNFFANQVKEFTCNIYGKDLIKLKTLPKKIFG